MNLEQNYVYSSVFPQQNPYSQYFIVDKGFIENLNAEISERTRREGSL